MFLERSIQLKRFYNASSVLFRLLRQLLLISVLSIIILLRYANSFIHSNYVPPISMAFTIHWLLLDIVNTLLVFILLHMLCRILLSFHTIPSIQYFTKAKLSVYPDTLFMPFINTSSFTISRVLIILSNTILRSNGQSASSCIKTVTISKYSDFTPSILTFAPSSYSIFIILSKLQRKPKSFVMAHKLLLWTLSYAC